MATALREGNSGALTAINSCIDPTSKMDRPSFWSHPSINDGAIIAAQNAGRRFDLSIVLAVARRCGYGFPQVIVCYPLAAGKPFPTVFWLSCPCLGKKCGALESEQQISRLEELFAARIEKVQRWHRQYSALRKSLFKPEEIKELAETCPDFLKAVTESGVGGINYRENPGAAKCLHLQAASWLGMGWHPASDWLSEKVGSLQCSNAYCEKLEK